MPKPIFELVRLLSYAGLLPFLGPAFLVWILPEATAQTFVSVFVIYSALILSFLGGLLWAAVLLRSELHDAYRPILWGGIGASLTGLLAAFVVPDIALALLAVGFVMLRQLEQRFLLSVYPEAFAVMRDWLTRIVLACHVSVWVFVLQS